MHYQKTSLLREVVVT